MLESGSDFKSRGMAEDSRVVFGPGVTVATCNVTLIDDSEYEGEEEFEIVLADASDNARIGSRASASVFIGGPNDASTVFLGNETFTVSEAAGEEWQGAAPHRVEGLTVRARFRRQRFRAEQQNCGRSAGGFCSSLRPRGEGGGDVLCHSPCWLQEQRWRERRVLWGVAAFSPWFSLVCNR